MMKSGDMFISGYWPRESNPGFRDNCGTNTSYATETVSRLSYYGILGLIPGTNIQRLNISRFHQWPCQ